MTAATRRPGSVMAPTGMRSALVPVLRRCHETDTGQQRRIRAAGFRMVAAAFRSEDLAAVGVGELELLADALDGSGS